MIFEDMQLWHAYFMPMCRHTIPDPKDKIAITVDKSSDQFLFFFVNTEVREFIKIRPHLRVCEAQIKVSENPYLDYDSFVDCRVAYRSYPKEFNTARYSGPVSIGCVQSILHAITACVVLELKHKKAIIKNANDFLNSGSSY